MFLIEFKLINYVNQEDVCLPLIEVGQGFITLPTSILYNIQDTPSIKKLNDEEGRYTSIDIALSVSIEEFAYHAIFNK